ncbi:MAG: DUF262 domain-containing HNH endonuclease family protein [Pseudomonadota bacterium]
MTLAQLFSGAHRFRLPAFQRAFAWQTSHVGRLLDNIREAMRRGRPYQLGVMTLVERDGSPDAAIIDGHQRIMALTILFAVLRDLEIDPSVKERLSALIIKPPRGRLRTGELVLQPQPLLADFMAELVQRPGVTLRDPVIGEHELSETEHNILENRDYLIAALADGQIDLDERRQLSEFLLDECRLILRIMDDEVEAWRTLETEEATRVDFNACSRAKASILSALPLADRERCGRVWEQCEQLVGADDMHALLGFVRTLKLRHRAQKPVETEIWEHAGLEKGAAAFFEGEMLPAARRLRALKKGEIGAGEAGKRLAERLARIGWVQLDFWIPAALHWLAVRGEADAETEAFFARLERLVWIARIANLETPKQEKRTLALLTHIDKGRHVDEMAELAIEKKLKQEALANLESTNFRQKAYSALVLRRISVALGKDSGPYDRDQVTFEHIIPRNPEEDRGWRRILKSWKQVEPHINRLGNLTFLTREENNRAGTRDWEGKREVYRESVHVLAREAASREQWSVGAVAERTEELIAILLREWDLKQ